MKIEKKGGKFSEIRSDAPALDAISLFEGENAYAEAVDRGNRIDERARKILLLAVALAVIYVLEIILPKGQFIGGVRMSLFVGAVRANMGQLFGTFVGEGDNILYYVPDLMLRCVVIALAGAGLALCGAVYQGAFRNALVAPSTLGVMSGAQLGIAFFVVMSSLPFMEADHGPLVTKAIGWLDQPLGDEALGLSVFSFIGCLVVVGLVLLTMRAGVGGRASGIMLIITGQIIGGICGAVVATTRYYYAVTEPYGAVAQKLTQLMISSFYRTFLWTDVFVILVPLAVTFFVVMRLRQKMMTLAFDEGESRAMGVDARRMRFAAVALCTLLTAIIVSFCGAVGFVGFLVPHLARRMVGPNFRYLLPASTTLGAVFLLGANLLLEITFGPYQTMLGMYISIGGAAVFLVTALRGKGAGLGQFR
jgi:iron complex transport system permease protein